MHRAVPQVGRAQERQDRRRRVVARRVCVCVAAAAHGRCWRVGRVGRWRSVGGRRGNSKRRSVGGAAAGGRCDGWPQPETFGVEGPPLAAVVCKAQRRLVRVRVRVRVKG